MARDFRLFGRCEPQSTSLLGDGSSAGGSGRRGRWRWLSGSRCCWDAGLWCRTAGALRNLAGTCWEWRAGWRYGTWCAQHAAGFWRWPGFVVVDQRERQRRCKKHGRTHGGGARQKVGAARCAKQATRSAAAKRCAHIRTFAMLNEHQPNHHQGRDDLQAHQQVKQHVHAQTLRSKGCVVFSAPRGRWRQRCRPSRRHLRRERHQ